MRVSDIMKRHPRFVSPDQTLALAGALMAEVDCGVLPVLTDARISVGVVTDRDICLSLVATDCRPSDVTVAEVMSAEVFACRPDDDLATALATMRNQRVRRLPVLDRAGTLQGLLSLDDIAMTVRGQGSEASGSPDLADVARTLGAINEHRVPSLVTG